jgi:Protein of unknown function (DUF2563)
MRLRSRFGTESCRRAQRRKVTSWIFGDFAEAQQFHGKLSAGRQHHQERLQSHHATLNGVSGKATKAAGAFTARDESAADAIKSAAGGFD